LRCWHRHLPALYPLMVPCRYWRPAALGVVKPKLARSGTARSRAAGESCCGMGKRRSPGPRLPLWMCVLSLPASCVLSLRRRYSLSLGYSLTRNLPPVGWNFGSTCTTVRLIVRTRVAGSRSFTRSPVSSPHRMPVSMSVSTISCKMAPGIAAKIASNWSGVMILRGFLGTPLQGWR
jgi:hypothetical protein